MSLNQQQDDDNNNQKNPKKALKLLDCFKHCFKPKKKTKDESKSEAEIILAKNKDLLKFDINTLNKINKINCNKRNSNYLESPKHKKKLMLTPLKVCLKNNKTSKSNTITTFQLSQKKPSEYENSSQINFYQTIKFLHPFKDKFACLFCGGKSCKHEDFHYNLNNNNAIKGLHSNFITENVIASQRPSEVLIKDYTLLSQFKRLNIGLIINLQREGEHPYCGPNAKNLTQAGFAYNPSVFTGNDIQCKISGWKDMDVPTSMNFMLEIVKDMSEFIENFKSKILVHCHAGYGRTGVVIVCYLLYNTNKDTDTIIKEVRSKRKKCVETKKQVKYCKRFEEYLKHSREIFGKKDKIDVYLKKQENILFGFELEKYGYIPKLLLKVLEKIQMIKYKNNLSNVTIYKFILNYEMEINEDIENILKMMKFKINNNDWGLFDNNYNLTIVLELMFNWLEEHVEFVISLERTKKILNNELYIKYIKLISNNSIKNIKEIDLVKKSLLKFIKKVYFFYEYEIIYKFALFFSGIPYSTKEEEKIFINCLEKISTGLLGYFSQSCSFNNYFNENNSKNEDSLDDSSIENGFNKKDFTLFIKPVIIGLTNIMKLIYEIILNSNLNGTDLSITADDNNNLVTPKRRIYGIFSKYSNKFLSNNFSKLNSLNSEIDNDILRRQSWGGMLVKKKQNDSKYSTPNSGFYSHKSYKNLFSNYEKNFKYYNLYLALDKYYNGNNNSSLKNIYNKSSTENVLDQIYNPNEIIDENKVIENISDLSDQMKNNSSFCNDIKDSDDNKVEENKKINNKDVEIINNNDNKNTIINNGNNNININKDDNNNNDNLFDLQNIITKKYKINNSRTYEKNIGFIFNSNIFNNKKNDISNDNNKNTSRNNLIMELKNENKNSRNSMKIQNSKFSFPQENGNKKKRKSLFLIKKN